MDLINIANIKVSPNIYKLINEKIIPGTNVTKEKFWNEFSSIIEDLSKKNETLLKERDEIQETIDNWHLDNKNRSFDIVEYKKFLEEINYLIKKCPDFKINTKNIDKEISMIAGPQLVVPVDNARFAINAANARWWSLYDSLYGTDAIPEEYGATKTTAYNIHRGSKVVSFSNIFLDNIFSLENSSYSSVSSFQIDKTDNKYNLIAILTDNTKTQLTDPSKFVGYTKKADGELTSILLKNNGLHIEIQLNREDSIGKLHSAGIKDILIESAITAIQDFEDSVSAVDEEDKISAYTNWTDLMKGTITSTFTKDGSELVRTLNPDKIFISQENENDTYIISGRSLILARNVGIHMYTDIILTKENEKTPEGFLDIMVTALASMHDLNGNSKYSNSPKKSIYIVKPKMHGPKEVAATVELFSRVEKALNLNNNTIKIGIMDEERRTSVNLQQCIYEAKDRIIFINTGFLDRTGDEIHTSMKAGAFLPKSEIKNQPWIQAYEDQNVDIAIKSGFIGKAQIGKGMWAMPDEMKEMLNNKIGHPKSGASTAWVPSPTAAALHALHYHYVNVKDIQDQLLNREPSDILNLLTPPLMSEKLLEESQIQKELENNAQSILGYVSRWIGQGIGCSKVLDIDNVALMEDRATLRISSQHIANWILHDITNKEDVISIFKRMAKIVDIQNKDDVNYTKMSDNYEESIEFQAALELVFNGVDTPNGYTEDILHSYRRKSKNP